MARGQTVMMKRNWTLGEYEDESDSAAWEWRNHIFAPARASLLDATTGDTVEPGTYPLSWSYVYDWYKRAGESVARVHERLVQHDVDVAYPTVWRHLCVNQPRIRTQERAAELAARRGR